MATPTPLAPQQVNAVGGESIAVHLIPVHGVPNEVTWRVTRNGAHSDRFSLIELQAVVDATNRLLAQARGRSVAGLAQHKPPVSKAHDVTGPTPGLGPHGGPLAG